MTLRRIKQHYWRQWWGRDVTTTAWPKNK